MILRNYTTGFFAFLVLCTTSACVIAGSDLSVLPAVSEMTTQKGQNSSSGELLQDTNPIIFHPSSLEELKLDNATILAIGPNSRIKLDRGSKNLLQHSSSVSLEKGPFRLISTSIGRKDLQIQTPNVSLNSETSVLDIYISSNGAEYLLLHSGITKVCNHNASEPSRCTLLEAPCSLIRVSPNGKIGDPFAWRDRTTELDLTFSETFPFILNPPKSDPIIYHSRTGIEDNKCGSINLASDKLNSLSTYETGALPKKRNSEQKDQKIKSEEKEPPVPSRQGSLKLSRKFRTSSCEECEYFETADKYFSKILRLADNNFMVLWTAFSVPKTSKKLYK